MTDYRSLSDEAWKRYEEGYDWPGEDVRNEAYDNFMAGYVAARIDFTGSVLGDD